MKRWIFLGALYAALFGWMVCTYFCTVPGYDEIAAVRNSICRPHTIEVADDGEGHRSDVRP